MGRLLTVLIVPGLLLVLWEAAVRTGVFPNTLIASPSQVVVTFLHACQDGTLPRNAAASLERLGAGFCLGAAVGIVFGLMVGASRLASRLFEPTILGFIPIPSIAWIPLLIILLGIGDASKIALIAIGSFCTLFLQTAYGVRTADRQLVEVGHVLGKSRKTILFRILLPCAMPSILSGMRVAFAISWGLLIAAEMIASSKGIGWMIWDARNFSRPDDMIVGMIAAGILGQLGDMLLVRLERYVTRWRRTYRDVAHV